MDQSRVGSAPASPIVTPRPVNAAVPPSGAGGEVDRCHSSDPMTSLYRSDARDVAYRELFLLRRPDGGWRIFNATAG